MGDSGDADILELTADKLRAYTNGFSQDNFLGNTQFGKLYRGKIPCASTEAEAQEVTVKIWQDPTFYVVDENDKKSRLADELHFLKHPSVKTRGNLVKLIGYSRKGEPLGVVYDLNPLDTLHNLITKGRWSVKCDVYSYGILLLSLIGKRVVDKVRGYETAVDVWAKKEYKPKKSFFKRKERFSLVHNSLQEESTYDISDGYKITELAMSCVECFPVRRPTMQKVSEDLQALHVVQSNAEAFGIKPDVAAKKPKLGSRFSIRW